MKLAAQNNSDLLYDKAITWLVEKGPNILIGIAVL
ncbi:hypothetical protein ABIB30_000082 [Pedobacter sp. UYP1]